MAIIKKKSSEHPPVNFQGRGEGRGGGKQSRASGSGTLLSNRLFLICQFQHDYLLTQVASTDVRVIILDILGPIWSVLGHC